MHGTDEKGEGAHSSSSRPACRRASSAASAWPDELQNRAIPVGMEASSSSSAGENRGRTASINCVSMIWGVGRSG